MKIESFPAKEFLVIKGFANLYDTDIDKSAIDENVWGIIRKQFSDSSVECLKKEAGSENVYMLFCNTCKRDDVNKCYTCSYDIACENYNHNSSNKFTSVILRACDYLSFDCTFDNETLLSDAHESTDMLFWGDNGWLKEKPFVCAIDYPENSGKGYAQIEQYTPFDIDATKLNMKIWYPILPQSE